MPWMNGAGTTHEIAIDPTPGPAAPFRWRLSMADLTGSGPFSSLPDVDRILVLLHGDDAVLTIDGTAAPLLPLAPVAFAADVPSALTMPPGTGRDLNLMWDRTRAEGAVDILHIGDIADVAEAIAFAVALDGSATIGIDEDEHVLGEYDALQIDGGGTLTVLDGHVAVARVD